METEDWVAIHLLSNVWFHLFYVEVCFYLYIISINFNVYKFIKISYEEVRGIIMDLNLCKML